jgi:hypothetical protein
MVVRMYHLSTGEDIIGEMLPSKPGYATVGRPVRPNVNFDPQTGRVPMGLMPVLLFSDKDEEIMISADHIVFSVGVKEDVARLYQQSVSSIQVAGPGDIKTLLKG